MNIRGILRAAATLSIAWPLACCSNGPPPGPGRTVPLEDGRIVIANVRDVEAGVTFDRVEVQIMGFDWQEVGVVEAAYKDGKAVLTLPASIAEANLMKASRENAGDYTGMWPAAADDPSARGAKLGNIWAWRGQTRVGRLWLGETTPPSNHAGRRVMVGWHYADRPFSLSGYNLVAGGGDRSFRYRASFAAGWSAYADIWLPGEQLTLCTTSIPADATLTWRME